MKLSEYIDKVMTRIRFPSNKFTNYGFTHQYVHIMCIFRCPPRISLLFIVSNLLQIYWPHHACFASAMGLSFFLFFFFASVIIFLFLIKFLDESILKTWNSWRMSYFVSVLRVGDIFSQIVLKFFPC